MTWNFVAGLAVAREILESYGCVVRVISPRTTDAALGAGGTRVELWFPSLTELSDFNGHTQEVQQGLELSMEEIFHGTEGMNPILS